MRVLLAKNRLLGTYQVGSLAYSPPCRARSRAVPSNRLREFDDSLFGVPIIPRGRWVTSGAQREALSVAPGKSMTQTGRRADLI